VPKEDAGDGAARGVFKRAPDQGCFLLHLTLTIATGNCL
jgi:hypothetical protein